MTIYSLDITPFPILSQSIVPCPVLTVASWPAYRFLKRQVRWSGISISFRIFHSYCDPHTSWEIDGETVESSERDGNTRPPYLRSWEICMQVKKQQLEPDMEQRTGSKLGKEYIKAVYCHSAYLTYMQSTSWETLGWLKHKLESRLPRQISITSDTQMTPPLWQKAKRN